MSVNDYYNINYDSMKLETINWKSYVNIYIYIMEY